MFKSSQNLRLAAEMRALQRVAAPWREARATWFDGTPDSIAARLAATERVLAHARSGYTAAHLALTAEAETARRELLAAKHRLLTDFLDDGARAFQGSKRVADMAGERGSSPYDHYPQAQEWLNGHSEPEQMFLAPLPSDQEWISRGAPHHGSRRTADETTGFGKLGPGYEHFGPDDLDEYDEYLHRHDYHTEPDDLHALEHKLRPGYDDDDPARYSHRRTAGDGPGTIDDLMLQSMGYDPDGRPLNHGGSGAPWSGSNSPYGDEGFSGSLSGTCRHCGEEIALEHPEGDWVHPDTYKESYEGSYPAELPGRDHSAEPDEDY